MVRWSAFVASVCAAALITAFAQPPNHPDLPTVLVSRQLMTSEHLRAGDVVTLATDALGTNGRSFRIGSQYEPVPDPMRLGAARHEVRMHLPDLLALVANSGDPLDPESVDAINVALPGGAEPKLYERELPNRIPGITARSTKGDDQRAAPFIVLERFHLAIAIVTVMASGIFLLALMLMLVDERRETVGILRLVGFRRRRILVYVFAEGVVLAAAGAVAGILLAAAFQGGINRFFQWRYDTALVFVRVTPPIALRSIVMAVPLGVLAAIASSWSLIRREVFSLVRR
jgi:putative ABC transport system permease protein